jgi:hypothetical protein
MSTYRWSALMRRRKDVSVPMQVRLVAWLVAVLQHADPVVLEDHLIEARVSDGGVVAAHGYLPVGSCFMGL